MSNKIIKFYKKLPKLYNKSFYLPDENYLSHFELIIDSCLLYHKKIRIIYKSKRDIHKYIKKYPTIKSKEKLFTIIINDLHVRTIQVKDRCHHNTKKLCHNIDCINKRQVNIHVGFKPVAESRANNNIVELKVVRGHFNEGLVQKLICKSTDTDFKLYFSQVVNEDQLYNLCLLLTEYNIRPNIIF